MILIAWFFPLGYFLLRPEEEAWCQKSFFCFIYFQQQQMMRAHFRAMVEGFWLSKCILQRKKAFSSRNSSVSSIQDMSYSHANNKMWQFNTLLGLAFHDEEIKAGYDLREESDKQQRSVHFLGLFHMKIWSKKIIRNDLTWINCCLKYVTFLLFFPWNSTILPWTSAIFPWNLETLRQILLLKCDI